MHNNLPLHYTLCGVDLVIRYPEKNILIINKTGPKLFVFPTRLSAKLSLHDLSGQDEKLLEDTLQFPFTTLDRVLCCCTVRYSNYFDAVLIWRHCMVHLVYDKLLRKRIIIYSYLCENKMHHFTVKSSRYHCHKRLAQENDKWVYLIR